MTNEEKIIILENQIKYIYKELKKVGNYGSESLKNYSKALINLEHLAEELKLRIADEEAENDKETPKKVIRTPYKDIYGNELLESKSHFYNGCPSCKDNVGIDAQYCRHCGQALDWSDEDDK